MNCTFLTCDEVMHDVNNNELLQHGGTTLSFYRPVRHIALQFPHCCNPTPSTCMDNYNLRVLRLQAHPTACDHHPFLQVWGSQDTGFQPAHCGTHKRPLGHFLGRQRKRKCSSPVCTCLFHPEKPASDSPERCSCCVVGHNQA